MASNTAIISRDSWIDSDEIARALSNITPIDYDSKTISLDLSIPPSPDRTGRPTNFSTIAPGLYRSSYPHISHFEALEDLNLKTIITFVPEELPFSYANFITSHGIIHHPIHIKANKDAEVYTDVETIKAVQELMLDPNNYPMLIHCNKGKHRTGCMTACFRKICGWSDEAAIEEYIKFSTPKDRDLDKAFIKRFDPEPLKSIALERGYVGGVYAPPVLGDTGYSERSFTTSYTTSSVATYSNSETGEIQHEYQERIRRENNAALAEVQRWSHR